MCTPGPCGPNADCYVSDNQEQCYCKPGFTGNPYSGCQKEPHSPCYPNPCGPNAICQVSSQGQAICLCPDGLQGDPFGSKGMQIAFIFFFHLYMCIGI